MRKILFSLLAVALCVPAFAGLRQKQADKDTNQFRYEIECAGNAIQGTYLVKVWTYSKKPSVAENQCRKNAVLEEADGATLPYTTFTKVSGGEILPGMLLIEGKYRKITE